MDAFEGLHTVQLSSPAHAAASNPGYEVVVSATSGLQVYSNSAFYGKPSVLQQAQRRGKSRYYREEAEAQRCPVGSAAVRGDSSRRFLRGLVDLEPPSGRSLRGECRVQADSKDPRPKERSCAQARSQARDRERSTLEGAAQLEGVRGREHEANLSRLRSSSLEIREKGSEILREQLDAAQKELKLKDKECERLSQVRTQLELELEELTASLFEEAHRMVREANVKQAGAERQLKEAEGKIDVLQAEVSALKTLVLTSTPSSPNRHAHPQLLSSGTRSSGSSPRTGGTHTRNKSASCALPLPTGGNVDTSSDSMQPIREGKECLVPGHSLSVTFDLYWAHQGQGPQSLSPGNRTPLVPLQAPFLLFFSAVDNVLYAEFLAWREKPCLDRTSAFLQRIYVEDISPCLSFTRSELSQSVQSAVENNSLTIEPVAMSAVPMVKASSVECGGPNGLRAAVETKCALSGISRSCKHRIKLGDKESYYYISPSSRARITAVCNFFTYIRYIQQGLVRHDAEQMFWEVMRLRREMTVAKLGFYPTNTDQ
ncbi:hypothetical protein UPYG_G00272480 [Umbra pygmaea]|uniref:GDP/GTP exchange factor Sec2 N-terminal domain-containing protein n=1 Tax=Umbra pygmaea TaxID=75934 RepID=A0ABD0X1J5_UMBPY